MTAAVVKRVQVRRIAILSIVISGDVADDYLAHLAGVAPVFSRARTGDQYGVPSLWVKAHTPGAFISARISSSG